MENYQQIIKTSVALLFAVLTILLLDSHGLHSWASRLEIGEVRTETMKITSRLSDISERLGLDSPKNIVEKNFRTIAGIEAKAGYNPEEFGKTDSILSMSAEPAPDTLTVVQAIVDPFRQLRERHPDAKHPLNLLLLGDSMMGRGLGTVISRSARRDTLFNVHRVSELSSGLTRTDFFDWFVQADILLKEDNYDIVIATMGTNDAQAAEINGVKVPFGTELWVSEYSIKVREFLSILSKGADVVYWFGLPPMQEEGFNSRISRLNDIYRDVIKEFSNIIYYPLDEVIGDYALKFTSYKHVKGELTRVRLEDGIHLTNDGGKIVANDILGKIKSEFQ